MARVSVQGQARRSRAAAGADCPVPPAPRLADVVRRYGTCGGRALVPGTHGEVAAGTTGRGRTAGAQSVSRSSAALDSSADVPLHLHNPRRAQGDGPMVESRARGRVLPSGLAA